MQPDLLGQATPSSPLASEQGEFYPQIDLAGKVPTQCRIGASFPVQLETTGVTSQSQQLELLNKKLVQKQSIVAKLASIGAFDLAEPLKRCHTEQKWAQCEGCRKVRTFWNRCENFYCPSCQPTLARERAESLKWWANQVSQPKHIVLTVRNTAVISWLYVKWFKKCLTKLRRRRFAKNWRGGLWSIEVTNEGMGWHLHAHLLVDCKWVDPSELARQWAQIVGQDFAIVNVRDARNREYLAEVTKYAVKGSMLSSWSPEDIAHFINAFSGHRLFGVFGTLYGKRTEWRAWIDSVADLRKVCDCGCDRYEVFTASEWCIHLRREHIISGKLGEPPPIGPVAASSISVLI